jgi:hypothetical protein
LPSDTTRVLTIVYALNRVWPPTTKRVALRVEGFPVKPERLAERIEKALTQPNPFPRAARAEPGAAGDRRARLSGRNFDRARVWLSQMLDVHRDAAE